ncbi:unnamed protein product [Euphydryas editha]|uniref:CCHC-type domain-containing protein n=1 Tax=Euphydryas editha TaxID=104508 RepID=A0AAU9UXK6_EUPED|nr:unnamed protein product [Euphydryas editha]
MEKFIITHFENKDMGSESTAVDSDDYSSAATAGETSSGQTRSGKRFRSSPRATGEGSVILAGCKKRILMREEPCTEAERAIEEQVRAAEEGRRALGLDVGDARTADALCKQVVTDVDLIYKVATRSSNLKSMFARALKDSAASIKAVVEALRDRSASEEVRKLQAENNRLRRDLDDLHKQVELRKHRSELVASTCLPRQGGGLVEEVTASVVETVTRILDARLAGIEERLPPEKVLRPPLAADRRREEAKIAPASVPMAKKPKKKKRPRQRLRQRSRCRRRWHPRRTLTAAVSGPPSSEKKAQSYAAAAAASSAPRELRIQPSVKNKKKTRKPKLVAPRSPAVLITLEEYAESKGLTYCHLLERAAETVDLKALGIDGGLNIRRAATGARLLELPKGQTSETAERFAEELRKAFGSLARVVQPTKLASLRVSGLDDSVTSEAVAAAAAKMGRCDAGSIKVGAIAIGPGGLGCTIVRCPIPVAKALAEAGRLLVGWSSARVQVLEQRPMRCFKCLGIGHTRPTCPAAVDRSGACFRCGLEGHIARNCTGALRCAVCAAAGKSAAHLMGGRDCHPPNRKVERSLRPRPLPKAQRARLRRRLRLCRHDLPQSLPFAGSWCRGNRALTVPANAL